MKIAILHSAVPPGAPADEQDVFVQVETVRTALKDQGHTVLARDFPLDLDAMLAWLRRERPEAIFNLVETVAGSGRLIHLAPALYDLAGIPYTGASTEAMFLTSNKLLSKQLLRSLGLPTPAWYTAADVAADGPVPPGRYIVKSVWEHASVGLDDTAVLAAADRATLRAALATRRDRQGGECFAEAYIDGREFNLALVADGARPEPTLLPPAEILFEDYAAGKPRIVGYEAKWQAGSFEFSHTPRRFNFPPADSDILSQLGRLARQCWKAFGLKGYARVDFRVDAAYNSYVLEINANPCLSPDAGFTAALGQAKIPIPEAIRRILLAAVSARQAPGPAEFGGQHGHVGKPVVGPPAGGAGDGPRGSASNPRVVELLLPLRSAGGGRTGG